MKATGLTLLSDFEAKAGRAIPPVVPQSDSGPAYRITPQKRWEAVEDKIPKTTGLTFKIMGARFDLSPGVVTANVPRHIQVKELVYPGSECVDVEDKWIYVVADGSFYAEIYAESAARWKYTLQPKSEGPPGELDRESPGYLPVRSDLPEKVEVFLSPVRLTSNAKKYLLRNAGVCCVAITIKFFGPSRVDTSKNIIVGVPDPFHWCALAHELYYLRKLEKLQELLSDEQIQAQRLIADTLRILIGNGTQALYIPSVDDGKLDYFQPGPNLDPADILDELTMHPKAWLKRYYALEQSCRREAEIAMAYVAHTADSFEHHTVEIASMETGGQALADAYLEWAIITRSINLTTTGVAFAKNTVTNRDRLPAKYLFADGYQEKELEFSDFKKAWKAAMSCFKELLPVAAETWKGPDKVAMVARYVEHIGIKNLKGFPRRIAHNALKGRPLNARAPSTKMRRFNIAVAMIEAEGEAYHSRTTPGNKLLFEKLGRSAERIHKNFVTIEPALKCTVGAVLEVVNLWAAAEKFVKGREKGETETVLASTASFLKSLNEVFILVVKANPWAETEKLLKKSGQWLNVVAGICDAMEASQATRMGLYEDDYGKALAQGVKMAGACTSAIGGAMVVAGQLIEGELTLGAAGGPPGEFVAAIGAAITFLGALCVVALSQNSYENFSNHCFLGKNGGRGPKGFAWSPVAVGGGTAVEETTALIAGLLAHFRVEFKSYLNGNVDLVIYPGFSTDKCVFEIVIEKRLSRKQVPSRSSVRDVTRTGGQWKNYEGPKAATPRAKVLIFLGRDEIVEDPELAAEAQPFLKTGDIKRSSGGSVEEIVIGLGPSPLPDPMAQMKAEPETEFCALVRLLPFGDTDAEGQLTSASSKVTTPNGAWVFAQQSSVETSSMDPASLVESP